MREDLAGLTIRSFQEALNTLFVGVASFVPRLVVAILAFLILWFVAVIIGKLIEQVVRSLKLDALLEGLGANEPLSRAGYKLNTGEFLGGLIRWFFIIIAFLVAVDVLQLQAASEFLSRVLTYLPNVAVAALMVIAAALLADTAQKIVRGAAQAAEMPAAGFIGAVAKWAIWVFAIAVVLIQLGITPDLIQNLLTAFFAMFALAGGLAFGLGGKEHASQFIDKLRKEMRS